MLCGVRCLMSAVCRILPAVCCLLSAVYCLLSDVWCLLPGARPEESTGGAGKAPRMALTVYIECPIVQVGVAAPVVSVGTLAPVRRAGRKVRSSG